MFAQPVIIETLQEGHRKAVIVRQAPFYSLVSGPLLVDLEYNPSDLADFDGDVLSIRAINGLFRYRVDRLRTIHQDFAMVRL